MQLIDCTLQCATASTHGSALLHGVHGCMLHGGCVNPAVYLADTIAIRGQACVLLCWLRGAVADAAGAGARMSIHVHTYMCMRMDMDGMAQHCLRQRRWLHATCTPTTSQSIKHLPFAHGLMLLDKRGRHKPRSSLRCHQRLQLQRAQPDRGTRLAHKLTALHDWCCECCGST